MKLNFTPTVDTGYKPKIFNLKTALDKHSFEQLLLTPQAPLLVNSFKSQKKELIKTRMPGKLVSEAMLEDLYQASLNGLQEEEEGVWIFYPWLNKLVHTLSRDEFIELRTNRNYYKITPAEQQLLAAKTIGIIGLSVGHAVAVCIATERICGKLKLADFDTIDLSNLNRIKTSITNIGLNKAIVTAREIAETDPFIEVECFTEGITNENLNTFLLDGGKLDVLIDECDGLDVKINCRRAAKQHGIPVVMETSDKGMLDVERYDLDKDMPVLHGLLQGIDLDNLKDLTNEQKIPIILKIADVSKGSVRGKASMLEVGQSISTWPQLASSVTLGGAVVTDVCRRILLQHYNESGRYYVDIESIAGNKRPVTQPAIKKQAFSWGNALQAVSVFPVAQDAVTPASKELHKMIEYANLAPSTGNDQPWKWLFSKGRLYLFHDVARSESFGDFDNIASYISFGGAFENLQLMAWELGYTVKAERFPLKDNPLLICCIEFYSANKQPDKALPFNPALVNAIPQRLTNRNPSQATPVGAAALALLRNAVESVQGAVLHCIQDKNAILSIGAIIGACDRIRLLNPRGHADFVQREMRWTPAEALASRDGIDIRTLGLTGPLTAALAIIKDTEVSAVLKEINGARALVAAAIGTVSTASMIGIITLPKYCKEHFFDGGIAAERLWLQATAIGFAVHPLISPFYLFPRVTKGNGAGLDSSEIGMLRKLREDFRKVVPLDDEGAEVFIFKLATAAEPVVKSLRLPVEETLLISNNEEI